MYCGASKHLCAAIAEVVRWICVQHLDPSLLQPLIACRLIPLSKNPGVRPIGICAVLRRIVRKVVLRVVGANNRQVTGMVQLCAGQKSGCETAVHALRSVIEGEAEAVLSDDAKNAFNVLNRKGMLHNLQILCPSFATCVLNYYRSDADLFVGGETMRSC